MFGNLGQLGQLGSLLKNMGEFREKIAQTAEALKSERFTGSAGGGLVEFDVSGALEPLGCRIDPTFFAQQDREMLEDLVTAAVLDALNRAKQSQKERMTKTAEELGLPGLDALQNGGFPGFPGM